MGNIANKYEILCKALINWRLKGHVPFIEFIVLVRSFPGWNAVGCWAGYYHFPVIQFSIA